MLTFHYAAHTCALATHIALEEANAAYRAVRSISVVASSGVPSS